MPLRINDVEDFKRERYTKIVVNNQSPTQGNFEIPFYLVSGMNSSGRCITKADTVTIQLDSECPMLLSDFEDLENLLQLFNLTFDESIEYTIRAKAIEGLNFYSENTIHPSLSLLNEDIKSPKTKTSPKNSKYIGRPLPNVLLYFCASGYGSIPYDAMRKLPPFKEHVKVSIEDISKKFIDNMQSSITDKLTIAYKEMEELQKKIINSKMAVGKLQLLNKIISNGSSSVISEFLSNTEPEIESYRIARNCIIFTTIPFYTGKIIYNGKGFPSKYVGKFEIRMYINTWQIDFRNIASPVKNFQCLHQEYCSPINDLNYTCIGDFANIFADAAGSFDLKSLRVAIVEYLRSYTHTDGRGQENFKRLPTKIPDNLHEFKNWVNLLKITE